MTESRRPPESRNQFPTTETGPLTEQEFAYLCELLGLSSWVAA